MELYGFEYPYSELCPVYKVRDPQAKEITEQTQERWEFLHYREHTHDYVNEGCENDLRILLVGDSFVRMFLKDDIAEGFRETLSIDWLNIPILDQVVEEYQPDIVVLESAQSALKDTVELVIQTEFADAQIKKISRCRIILRMRAGRASGDGRNSGIAPDIISVPEMPGHSL